MFVLAAALADPPATVVPDTSCDLFHSVPLANAPDVPVDVGVEVLVGGGGCDLLDTVRIFADGVLVATESPELRQSRWVAIGFDAWTPGSWVVELHGGGNVVALPFEVVDTVEAAPAPPTVETAIARAASPEADIRLTLRLDAAPGTELVAVESAGYRFTRLPEDTAFLTGHAPAGGDRFCFEVSARGRGATWGEPLEVCRDVLPAFDAPAPRDDAEASRRGCQTTGPGGTWSLLRR